MSENEPATAKRPKKRFRWLIRIGIVAILLLIGLVLIAGKIAKSYVTPDYIASLIESENNCRVEIESADVSIFSFPARVEIKGVKIGPRDEHADSATKLADRPPFTGVAAFSAKSITLEANLLDLIRKKISVEHLTFSEVSIGELLIEEEGGPRLTKDGPKLDDLFDPPVTVAGSPNPEYEEKKQRREAAKERKKLSKEQRAKAAKQPFAISELPLPATMSALNIENTKIYAKIRRNKTRITFSKVQIKVSDIDLDPSDLENHNKAKVTITCHLDIEDRDRTIKYADLDIRSEGAVIPFDPITGYVNPDLTYNITVLKGSKLDAIPALVKLATKIDKLEKIGLRLDPLADDITIDEDTTLKLAFREDALRLVEQATVGFNGHDLVIKEDAWLHTGTNRHEANAEILLSQADSDKALGKARDFLREQAKKYSFDQDIALRLANKLLEPVTKNGRVYVPFNSTGDFNDPKVRPEIDIEDLAEAMTLEAFGEILNKAQEEAGKQ